MEGDAGGAGSADCLNVIWLYTPADANPSNKCRAHSIELVLFQTDPRFK